MGDSIREMNQCSHIPTQQDIPTAQVVSASTMMSLFPRQKPLPDEQCDTKTKSFSRKQTKQQKNVTTSTMEDYRDSEGASTSITKELHVQKVLFKEFIGNIPA